MAYIIIVLYNKLCTELANIDFISKYKSEFKLVFFDNGSEKYVAENKKYCGDKNYIYFTLNKNVGLSKAYNYVIDNLNLKDEYVIMLDDDTKLPSKYFEEALKIIETKEYDIILPVVMAEKMIMSPSNVQFDCRVKAVKDIKDIDYTRITAINSGMIIKGNVFDKIKYNENMFLEYVDHDFMKKVRNQNLKIKIMNTVP